MDTQLRNSQFNATNLEVPFTSFTKTDLFTKFFVYLTTLSVSKVTKRRKEQDN